MSIAFGLRADLEGNLDDGTPKFGGGVLNVGDNQALDLAQSLRDGGGVIVVPEADAQLLAILDLHPALKRVAGKDKEPTVDTLDGLTAQQLRQEATNRGLEVGTAKKDAVLKALREYDAAVAAGDQDAANNVTVGDAGKEA